MLNDEKVGHMYQQIARTVIDMIPEEWDKVYLYGEVEEERQASFFFYYPVASKEPVYSLDIPELYEVDEEKFDQLKDQLYEHIETLWNEYKQSGEELWSTLNMIMERDKFKIEFGYEDLSAPETDYYERSLAWEYNYLGLVPKDSYAKKVLDEYLKKKESEQER
ncbi:immunity protein YezG family protein [Kroppenstedtia eburnea]|uniref:immunity protein YezG family protein n=1 Tax=Kroppenstedtia eburnea TaxID=714067 RepID=UPI0002E85E4A